jgi:dipeptidyl aminopeptidase/acylaminoacyl peptidase
LVVAVVFSPDGRRLATFPRPQFAAGDDRGHAYLWDAEAGGPPRVLAGHGDTVTDLAFSPDGRRLATLAGGRTPRWEVKVWDAATGQEVLTLLDPEQATAVRFAADGHKLYLFSHDRRAYDASPLPPALEAPDVADRLAPAATRQEVAAQLDALALSPELKAKAAAMARLLPPAPAGPSNPRR